MTFTMSLPQMLHDFPEYRAMFMEIAEDRLRDIELKSKRRISHDVTPDEEEEEDNAPHGDDFTPVEHPDEHQTEERVP